MNKVDWSVLQIQEHLPLECMLSAENDGVLCYSPVNWDYTILSPHHIELYINSQVAQKTKWDYDNFCDKYLKGLQGNTLTGTPSIFTWFLPKELNIGAFMEFEVYPVCMRFGSTYIEFDSSITVTMRYTDKAYPELRFMLFNAQTNERVADIDYDNQEYKVSPYYGRCKVIVEEQYLAIRRKYIVEHM